MATVTETRYTPEDLLTITDRPMPELVDGELVEREPVGQEADEIAARLVMMLGNYAKATLPAVVNGSQGGLQIFPQNPRKVRIPDVSFTRRDRLPGDKAARGHSRVVPELVVEVISPNDLASELQAKLADYDSAGIPWVLVIDPDSRIVVSDLGAEGRAILRVGDVIRGGDVLPGFECLVLDLFE